MWGGAEKEAEVMWGKEKNNVNNEDKHVQNVVLYKKATVQDR